MRWSLWKSILSGIAIFSVCYFATDILIHHVFYWEQVWRALEAGAVGGTLTGWLHARRKRVTRP